MSYEDNPQKLPQIDLCFSDVVGLVLPCKSGVYITNQTDGCCCRHPGVEGVFAPLPENIGGEGLSEIWCHEHKTMVELADAIDAWIVKNVEECHYNPRHWMSFRVRRNDAPSRIEEAWVPVTLIQPKATASIELNFISGFSGDAILTWPNSD